MSYEIPKFELPIQITKKGEPFRLNLNGIDFAFEKKLYTKIYTMCQRITKKHPILDACLINSGYEGDGKTNSSLVEAIIIQKLIGEETNINLFFKTSSCIEFAKKTEKQIIILDEPSFESLSTDTMSNLNKNFLRLISTMRKKRHFFIINFAKFWKFPDFLVVDRALGMVHMDSKQGKDPGKFMYIRKKNLERLWNDKKRKNKLSYIETKAFGGRMPYLMEDIFKKFNVFVEGVPANFMRDYDREKDKAICSIGEDKKVIPKRDLNRVVKLKKLRKRVANLWDKIGVTQLELAELLGINSKTLREWAKYSDEDIVDDKY